jgi:Flp pilus assembly protein TadD
MKKYTFYPMMILVASTVVLSSCKDKKAYESNASILKKAITAAADNADWENAKKLAFQAREQDPKDPNARVIFALALEQCNDLNRAIEEIKVATSLSPDNFMANYTQGRLLLKNEIYEDCPQPLEKAKKLHNNNPQVLLLLAKSYSLLNNHNEAIKNYIQLAKLKEFKQSPEIYNELGILFFKKKDYKRALRFLNKAYSLDSTSPSINLNLAVFWEKLAKLYDKKSSKKAILTSVKYYSAYENLLAGDPHSEPQRKAIMEKIKNLQSL